MGESSVQAHALTVDKGKSLSIKEFPMHDLIVGVVFIAMMIVPCIVAAKTGSSESEA